MAERHTVAMLLLHEGSPRDQDARGRLAAALHGASVGPADEEGVFEVVIEAADREQAFERVWDAVAASGTDDHIAFLEHPEVPDYWRSRAQPAKG
jgi:hypothetical protein